MCQDPNFENSQLGAVAFEMRACPDRRAQSHNANSFSVETRGSYVRMIKGLSCSGV